MKYIPLIFIIFIFLSCQRKLNKDEGQLIKPCIFFLNNGKPFSGYDIEYTVYKNEPFAPPTKYQYGDLNIIIENDSTLYYHKKSIKLFCGTGIDPEKPLFINLQPYDLVKVSLDSLLYILQNKILPRDIKRNDKKDPIVVISMLNDTIKWNCMRPIILTFHKVKFYGYVIRRISEEEQIVLNAKLNNQPYDSKKIKWKNQFQEVQ